jgi:hypothetical protein
MNCQKVRERSTAQVRVKRQERHDSRRLLKTERDHATSFAKRDRGSREQRGQLLVYAKLRSLRL